MSSVTTDTLKVVNSVTGSSRATTMCRCSNTSPPRSLSIVQCSHYHCRRLPRPLHCFCPRHRPCPRACPKARRPLAIVGPVARKGPAAGRRTRASSSFTRSSRRSVDRAARSASYCSSIATRSWRDVTLALAALVVVVTAVVVAVAASAAEVIV